MIQPFLKSARANAVDHRHCSHPAWLPCSGPMRLPPRCFSLALALLAFAALPVAAAHAEAPVAANPQAAILARIKAPAFPQRDFLITAYGAKSGEDCTAAIAKAIAAG